MQIIIYLIHRIVCRQSDRKHPHDLIRGSVLSLRHNGWSDPFPTQPPLPPFIFLRYSVMPRHLMDISISTLGILWICDAKPTTVNVCIHRSLINLNNTVIIPISQVSSLHVALRGIALSASGSRLAALNFMYYFVFWVYVLTRVRGLLAI